MGEHDMGSHVLSGTLHVLILPLAMQATLNHQQSAVHT